MFQFIYIQATKNRIEKRYRSTYCLFHKKSIPANREKDNKCRDGESVCVL